MKKHALGDITGQIGRPLITFIVILLLFEMAFLFLYNIQLNIRDRFDQANRLGNTVADEIERYQCLGFLLDYWNHHADEMDLVYENQVQLEEKELKLAEKLPDLTEIQYVTNRHAYMLDEEGQKLLAEIAYSKISDSMSILKRTYRPLYLYTFQIQGDVMFFYSTGALEDEKRISQGGELFELGYGNDYVPGRYPILDEVVATGHEASRLELSLQKGADNSVVHTFIPIYSGGKAAAIVGVAMPWKDLIRTSLALSLLVMGIAFLLFLLLTYRVFSLIRRVVLNPIKREQEIIRDYEADMDGAKAVAALDTINCRNEIETLADSFSSMVKEIDRYVLEITDVTAEKEKFETELALAAHIQTSSLPSRFPAFPDRKDFDIYAVMDSAREVGGDFYDFFMIDHDHIGLVMADVSGKGVPAALFMMDTKGSIKTYLAGGIEPAEAIRMVNQQVCENNPEEMFVTVWAGVLELSTGRLTAANAGHEYPIVKEPDGDFAVIKDKHGPAVGFMDGMTYPSYELELKAGAKLFLYTDGVPEATDENEEMFGMKRTVEALNRVADNTPEEILKAVSVEVRIFTGNAEQFDDMTMLCVHYTGAETGGAEVKELNIEATLENLDDVIEFVNAEMEPLDLGMKTQMEIELAVEELFTNIARYAYTPETGPASIRVEVNKEEPSVLLTFIDNGVPYDPLAKEDPDVVKMAQDDQVGGLGIFMVKKTMDQVEYEYKNGKNILRVLKKI